MKGVLSDVGRFLESIHFVILSCLRLALFAYVIAVAVTRATFSILLDLRSRAGSRLELDAKLGRIMFWGFRRLGGAWVKVGQLLSYRTDVLPASLLRELRGLQSAPILDEHDLFRVLVSELGEGAAVKFSGYGAFPSFSGSVADVFFARHQEYGQVAVKVVRSIEVSRFQVDAAMMRGVAWALRRFKSRTLNAGAEFMSIVQNCCTCQIDLRNESEFLLRIGAVFRGDLEVRVPILFQESCTQRILVMERVDPLFELSAGASFVASRSAVLVGLGCLYKMLFSARVVHCDLHPGNVQLDTSGRLVMLDFGLCADLSEKQAETFRRFFWGIATKNPEVVAASLVTEWDRRVLGGEWPAFVEEVAALVAKHHRMTVGEFQIAEFVSAVFQVLRGRSLAVDQGFFLPIVSLLVYEGVLKNVDDTIDFQKAALPYFFDLAMKSVMSWNRTDMPGSLERGRSRA